MPLLALLECVGTGSLWGTTVLSPMERRGGVGEDRVW